MRYRDLRAAYGSAGKYVERVDSALRDEVTGEDAEGMENNGKTTEFAVIAVTPW